MDGTFTPFHRREGSGPGRTSCVVCRISPARARWGTSNRNFTIATKHFPRGFPVVESSSKRYHDVLCSARALWSPCGCAPPGKEVMAILNTWGDQRPACAICLSSSSDCHFVLLPTLLLATHPQWPLLYRDLLPCRILPNTRIRFFYAFCDY